ncbi:bifunctional nuclease 1-like isoform X2 [Mangifera indica]|uniref:bifunctional nuclease 1-like isoform X2 n=1 Tax=Mangifera indica TaxID=29780 RepID=UPI001CFAB999|nr:bifunctional nuclease 1-like isoform X2 [Mangifera indica]
MSQFHVRTLSGFNSTFWDQAKTNASSCCSVSVQLQLCSAKRCLIHQSVLFSCKSSRRNFVVRSSNYADRRDDGFLPASLLVPETVLHYRMRRQGFPEDITWQSSRSSSSSNRLIPFPFRAKNSRNDVTSIGRQVLRRFQSPTIFLKISCDGDFLLPIIVGEFSVEKLLDALIGGEDNGACPDQFQFVKNLVDELGYEVNMVRITTRVVNTYFAKLYLSKPGKNDIINLNVRPSDAINVANRCKAPIYVSKKIVLADAIRIGYGTGRGRDAKPTYDVYLDSASEGPDSVAEELNLVRNMVLAVKEERYNDADNYLIATNVLKPCNYHMVPAAMLRDKLKQLRKSRGRVDKLGH